MSEVQQVTITKYQVRKPFKYNGRNYAIGEEWKPEGNRWDGAIIRTRQVLVLTQDVNALIEEGDEPATGYSDLTVTQLRDELKARGLSTNGVKAELIERLEADDLASDEEE